MSVVFDFLLKIRVLPACKTIASKLLMYFFQFEIPPQVILGKNVRFIHLGRGVILHPHTRVEDNVTIFPRVTVGRADAYKPYPNSQMESIVIKKGAVLCTGCCVLCKKGVLQIGENTVIGANAVIVKSTGTNQVWHSPPAVENV